MGLVEELLGCSLLELTRSYWAVQLRSGEWLCEARLHTDLTQGVERPFDWSLDLVANSDVLKIAHLWLLCPPTPNSPLGNTVDLPIPEPGTAFQFKVATIDTLLGETRRTLQAHIIGRVTDKETGACICYIYDPIEASILTPETLIYDPSTGSAKRDAQGKLLYAGRTNVYDFHSWRAGIAPMGRLEPETVGLRL